MRYRTEPDETGYVIRTVETGVVVGGVILCFVNHPQHPDLQIVKGGTVLNRRWEDTARILRLSTAALAIAKYEEDHPPRWEREDKTSSEKQSYHGILNVQRLQPGCWLVYRDGCRLMDSGQKMPAEFPTRGQAQRAADAHASDGYPDAIPPSDGQSWQGAKVPDPLQIEHRLGTLLADAACIIARGLIECGNGGLKPGTSGEVGKLIAQLVEIWWISQSRCYNPEHCCWEPYFAGATPAHPRTPFADAAQHYGRAELRKRFPGVGEAMLGALLSWPLTTMRLSLIACVQRPRRSAA